MSIPARFEPDMVQLSIVDASLCVTVNVIVSSSGGYSNITLSPLFVLGVFVGVVDSENCFVSVLVIVCRSHVEVDAETSVLVALVTNNGTEMVDCGDMCITLDRLACGRDIICTVCDGMVAIVTVVIKPVVVTVNSPLVVSVAAGDIGFNVTTSVVDVVWIVGTIGFTVVAWLDPDVT